MLDLEVSPEQSIGTEKWEFVLGMHFSQAVAVIQSQIQAIKGVQVLYSDVAPLEHDIILNLTNDGIQLHFDSIYQHLKVIEVYNMKSIKLRYCGNYFSSPDVVPNLEHIYNSFGATHPGTYDFEKQILTINFPGLAFLFPVDQKYMPMIKKGMGSLQFPSASPVVNRMLIYVGSNVTNARVLPVPSSCMHDMMYLDSLNVLRNSSRTTGICVKIFSDSGRSRHCETKQTHTRTIYFGSSCQEVSQLLGAPSKIFYKSEDKMKIHNARSRKAIARSDFFFNYFTLGFDILFDAKTQRAKKFILHTNFPGHYNFNMYHRCNFELPITINKPVDDNSFLIDLPATVTVKSTSLWETLANCISTRGRPVVIQRSSSTNSCNPFGSTFSYAYQDIIFEVMANGHISSVTLYESEEAP